MLKSCRGETRSEQQSVGGPQSRRACTLGHSDSYSRNEVFRDEHGGPSVWVGRGGASAPAHGVGELLVAPLVLTGRSLVSVLVALLVLTGRSSVPALVALLGVVRRGRACAWSGGAAGGATGGGGGNSSAAGAVIGGDPTDLARGRFVDEEDDLTVIRRGFFLPLSSEQGLTGTEGYSEGCGRAASRAVKTPAYSASSPLGSSPWNTVIYRKDTSSEWQFSCCGNIIAPNVVLTAASCVFVEQTRLFLNASYVRVIAAKTHNSLRLIDENSQQREVKKIYSPKLFRGEIEGFSNNLAILYVEQPFSLNDFVTPVCVDWEDGISKKQNLEQSSSENIVEVAGFGLSSNWSQQSGELQEGSFVVQKNKECRGDSRKPNIAKLRRYISYDKFCILTPFGTKKSDFGSGLVVQVGNRYYLQGIMSSFVDETFSLATNLTYHKSWLKTVMIEIEADGKCKDGFLCGNYACIPKSKKCDRVVDCEDGSDENKSVCSYRGPIVKNVKNQKSCTLPIQLGGASYRVDNCAEGSSCTPLAGTTVEDGQSVQITCGRGTMPSEKGPRYACLNGEWFQEIPKCIRMCAPRAQPGVDVKCDFNGGAANCSDYVRQGTEAVATCKRLHKLKDPYKTADRSKCLSGGKWSADLPVCMPECGVPNRIDDVTPTISYGKNATYGKYPWHVALYKKNSTSQLWEQICSGTILFPTNIVLTGKCVPLAKIQADLSLGSGRGFARVPRLPGPPNCPQDDARAHQQQSFGTCCNSHR
ncbi:hypothetical protein GE061_007142 [Apolygus lucorum]|uniref:Peptidase S1 domain-containing protein n=1 Tax=Apolygus lucorum TaxID=248454 RepID=A0A8S9WR38_APOLU|nr:hypothetical protein GE061_007142 [Apolygus lucorum]